MKPNKISFEFLKTKKANWVVNYESPEIGFNIHGKPDCVEEMYLNLMDCYHSLPDLKEYTDNSYIRIEKDVMKDDT